MADARVIACPVCGAPTAPGSRCCDYCRTSLATVRCGECLHLGTPDAVHCSECGAPVGLVSALEGRAGRCPECRVALAIFECREGTLLDCLECGGQLVQHSLLRALLTGHIGAGEWLTQARPHYNPLVAPVRYRRCPLCDATMSRRNFGGTSGIIIDVCAPHGSWFDAGELPKVLRYTEAAGPSAAAALPAAGAARPMVGDAPRAFGAAPQPGVHGAAPHPGVHGAAPTLSPHEVATMTLPMAARELWRETVDALLEDVADLLRHGRAP